MANPIIDAHMAIYEAHHEPAGISLAESKSDWRDLLDEDPGMQLAFNWGDLARAVNTDQIANVNGDWNVKYAQANRWRAEAEAERDRYRAESAAKDAVADAARAWLAAIADDEPDAAEYGNATVAALDALDGGEPNA